MDTTEIDLLELKQTNEHNRKEKEFFLDFRG